MVRTEEELLTFVESLRPSVAQGSSAALEVFDILMRGGEPWEALTALLENAVAERIAFPVSVLNRIEHDVLPEFGDIEDRERSRAAVEKLRPVAVHAAA